ncbi:electron carrier/ protein disulfide oxidoreductase [Actinidia rufa]|uniref:Electron carrier/ protein disulfide oxidoreductase n=1 Tax=Actinidia rufa TaxID=165716 RepID=A0A7J0EH52_9ERIC|nr:electron carrier/ protein disulfide oxidoreductase [Actinidia rufa]
MSNVDKEKGDSIGKNSVITQPDEMMEGNTPARKEDEDKKNVNALAAKKEGDTLDSQKGDQETEDYTEGSTAEKPERDKVDVQKEGTMEPARETKSFNNCEEGPKILNEKRTDELNDKMERCKEFSSGTDEGTNKSLKEIHGEEEEPVFDGTEVPGMEANRSTSTRSLDLDPETQGSAWPEKAAALKNFVRKKSAVAVSSVLRRLSGKSDDGGQDINDDEAKDDNFDKSTKEVADSSKQSEAQEACPKTGEKSGWNPLSLMKISRNADAENKQEKLINESLQPLAMKGRILLYTRLGCPDCREARLFLRRKKLRYNEINIDVYPSRKLELEKIAGSSAVPRVFFNEILIGGFTELKGLDEAGKLDEKIEYVITEVPPFEAPLPPLSGEDDMSTSGAIDELADIVSKMKESIPVKDRFYKMRRFINCFLGSEAVNFLSEDQYLEREAAVEFGQKLASKLFFQHVLEYLRIVEELQRVDLQAMPKEEKLAFFINLFNMMVIHAILVWGHPAGALERRKLLGDFKYVISGCTYSLSAIQNGILRANKRPPYNLIKPFGLKDKRFKVSLPYSEPLIHFALVCGSRSGPALRSYSPGNIDKELMEAACNFLRNGGLIIDANAKVASVSKILKWYSIDFGKNEVEVLKHAANYLEPGESEALLELLATTQLKVVYQPYDWGLNC